MRLSLAVHLTMCKVNGFFHLSMLLPRGLILHEVCHVHHNMFATRSDLDALAKVHELRLAQ